VVNGSATMRTETSDLVRRAMLQLKFSPARSSPTSSRRCHSRISLGFFVSTGNNDQPIPDCVQLLFGASTAALRLGVNLVFSFISDSHPVPQCLANGRLDGLLWYGKLPSAQLVEYASRLPTIWLMGDHDRPLWGDHVRPNDPQIGETAARYLAGRGHRHIACLMDDSNSWRQRQMTWSFRQTATNAGLGELVFQLTQTQWDDSWSFDGMRRMASLFVDQWLAGDERPTALFILDARFRAVIEQAFVRRGLRIGPGGDLEIIASSADGTMPGGGDEVVGATINYRADAHLCSAKYTNEDFY